MYTWIGVIVLAGVLGVLPKQAEAAGSGSVADVFVIRDINVPEFYSGQDITANITIVNKKFGVAGYPNPLIATLTVGIRDSQGNPVAAFDPDSPPTFNVTLNQNNPNTYYSVTIEEVVAPVFARGKTYTIYMKIDPYIDSDTSKNEKVTANNYGVRTFAVLENQNPVTVPDNPWWMGLVFVGSILGWMYISSAQTRKNNQK